MAKSSNRNWENDVNDIKLKERGQGVYLKDIKLINIWKSSHKSLFVPDFLFQNNHHNVMKACQGISVKRDMQASSWNG